MILSLKIFCILFAEINCFLAVKVDKLRVTCPVIVSIGVPIQRHLLNLKQGKGTFFALFIVDVEEHAFKPIVS